jgi:hypothetical protein
MGAYTNVGLVRSGSGFKKELSPSGTVSFAIKRGEAALKKYLGVTPASDAASLAGTNDWVESAATSFAIHYLALRLASQNIANVRYQRQDATMRGRGSELRGQAISAEFWWDDAIRICDMHGRDIIIERVTPS